MFGSGELTSLSDSTLAITGACGSDPGLDMVMCGSPGTFSAPLTFVTSLTSIPSCAWLFLSLITPGHEDRGSGKWLVKHLFKG